MNEIYVIVLHYYDEDNGIFLEDMRTSYYFDHATATARADDMNEEARQEMNTQLDEADAYSVSMGRKPMSSDRRRRSHEFRDTYKVVTLTPGD